MSGQPVFVLTVILLFSGLVAIFQWRRIKRKWYEFRLRRAIRKTGKKILRNVSVPDGIDGFIDVEYLVLAPTSIILLYVKRFKGVIFADDKIDLWTQVIDTGSFRFDNPLIQMDEDIMSIKAQLSNSDVKGYMIFTDESEFPKGKPDRVLSLEDVKKKACDKNDHISKELEEDWDCLVRTVK